VIGETIRKQRNVSRTLVNKRQIQARGYHEFKATIAVQSLILDHDKQVKAM